MQVRDARQAMLDVAAADGDIATGALWLAAEDCPGVEPDPWLERIDELSLELRDRCGIDGCRPSDAPLVAPLLRDKLRLHCAGGGDPQSHYLHSVLERGAGIPIACAAIWIAVGTRAAIPVEGVNTPGHFLVRVGDLLFDTVAGGEPLGEEDTRSLIGDAIGHKPDRLQQSWLRRATTREMLARMSRNLRGCYTCLEQWDLALRAADRCVDLMPDAPAERRDRGYLLWRMGRPSAALEDLRHYLDAAPASAPDRDAVDEVASRLRAFLN
ncbi:MAG: tetratricopeptide repeat protein [Candidatus Dormibacteraeota bacterium]|nr:tetratricopeptide repeat protein [Candidatus Dormibacteraeota bacterium]MBV9524336.1 tetratricopeptide repeat protein [Candidatus Dormibacteraeota bacterium]